MDLPSLTLKEVVAKINKLIGLKTRVIFVRVSRADRIIRRHNYSPGYADIG